MFTTSASFDHSGLFCYSSVLFYPISLRQEKTSHCPVLLQITDNTSHFPVTAITVLAVGFVAAVTIGSLAWYNSTRLVGWKEGEASQGDIEESKSANYDRKIISAETAARMRREGENFRNKPQSDSDLDTTGGYTVTREGLLNNYAVEPEMYVNTPGDLKEEQELEKEQRREELKEVNQEGGKGPGIV